MSFLCRSFIVLMTLIAPGFLNHTVADENRTTVPTRIVLAGDSTVTDEAGWGKGFAELLNEKGECVNLAKSGRSSRSYRTEGWWQKCLDAKPDYLLIQFGHNDQPGKGPERESAADSAFRDHLRAFIDEARNAGIKPVLVTSLTRRSWTKDGKIESTLAKYAEATTIVAKEEDVPLIDLHLLSIAQCEQLGPTAFRAFEPMNEKGADHTHLNLDGSRAVGPLVAKAFLNAVPEVAALFSDEAISAAEIPHRHSTSLSHGELQLEETASALTIRQSGKLILSYRKQSPPVPDGIDPIYQRSGFLDPVSSPTGQIVTESFPLDHPHQHGIFTAWVKTTWHDREIDFWNLAGGTGRVLHQRIINTFAEDGRIGFEADLTHRAEKEPVVDILRERWRITAFATDGSYHGFDLQTTQFALTDKPLIIQKYHYGGVAFRGRVRWLTADDGDARKWEESSSKTLFREPSEILNDLGSDRITGNHEHARWVSLYGQNYGKPVTITVLCHHDNFRAPQAARLHPTKPYFVFSPCVDGEFIIDRDHPFTSRYRYLITDAAPDAKWINEQWEAWQTQD